MTGSVKRLASNIFCTDGAILERLPSTWTYVIDKDSLKIKELEHVLIEKSAIFVIMLKQRTVSAFRACRRWHCW